MQPDDGIARWPEAEVGTRFVRPERARPALHTSQTGLSRRDVTNPERIVFREKGEYLLNFTAEITSSSASTVKFYFWPSKNGTNLSNLSLIKTIHVNGGVLTGGRTYLLALEKDDYIEMKWAVNSTSGSLNASAATAFAPASPASTLAITRIHA